MSRQDKQSLNQRVPIRNQTAETFHRHRGERHDGVVLHARSPGQRCRGRCIGPFSQNAEVRLHALHEPLRQIAPRVVGPNSRVGEQLEKPSQALDFRYPDRGSGRQFPSQREKGVDPSLVRYANPDALNRGDGIHGSSDDFIVKTEQATNEYDQHTFVESPRQLASRPRWDQVVRHCGCPVPGAQLGVNHSQLQHANRLNDFRG